MADSKHFSKAVPEAIQVAYISSTDFPSLGADRINIIKTSETLSTKVKHLDLFVPLPWNQIFTSKQKLRARIFNYYAVKKPFSIKFLFSLPIKGHLAKFGHGVLAPLRIKFSKTHYDCAFSRNILAVFICCLLQIPVFFENHRLLKEHYPFYYLLFRLIRNNRFFKGLVTNCNYIAEHYKTIGLPNEKILIAHNGFDPQEFYRTQARDQNAKPLICYTGNINRKKGMDSLLELSETLLEFDFLIVGGSQMEVTELQSHAANLKSHENLSFVPAVPQHQLNPYLNRADFFIIPPTLAPLKQHKMTVMPFKLYSYLPIGRPIITPDSPDITEIIADGVNGIVVPPDDIPQAAQKIRAALSRGEEYLSKLGENCLEMAPQFAWENRGKIISSFFAEKV